MKKATRHHNKDPYGELHKNCSETLFLMKICWLTQIISFSQAVVFYIFCFDKFIIMSSYKSS